GVGGHERQQGRQRQVVRVRLPGRVGAVLDERPDPDRRHQPRVPPLWSAAGVPGGGHGRDHEREAGHRAGRLPPPAGAELLASQGERRGRGTRQPNPPTSVLPPSRTSVWPVTQLACSDSRNATAAATSSGSPSRPSGYPLTTSASRPSYSARANRVRTIAGATALTRTEGASSKASWAVR